MADAEEPSVYETAEPSEAEYADPQPPPPQYESEFISAEEFDPEQARNRFDRFDCDNRDTDFASAKKRGWNSGLRQETNAEKLARIRRELEELRSETVDVADLDYKLSSLGTTRLSETFQNPGQSEGSDAVGSKSSEKLSSLEARLATLETRLGGSAGQNLAAEVELLRIKVNTLTAPETLNNTILPSLTSFNDEVNALSNSAVIARIDDLHSAIATITDIGPRLPLIVDRLKSLHKVHENAAESQMRLQAVRTALSQRATEIQEWKTSLAAIEEGMKVFATTSAQNSDALSDLNKTLLERLKKIQSETTS